MGRFKTVEPSFDAPLDDPPVAKGRVAAIVTMVAAFVIAVIVLG